MASSLILPTLLVSCTCFSRKRTPKEHLHRLSRGASCRPEVCCWPAKPALNGGKLVRDHLLPLQMLKTLTPLWHCNQVVATRAVSNLGPFKHQNQVLACSTRLAYHSSHLRPQQAAKVQVLIPHCLAQAVPSALP